MNEIIEKFGKLKADKSTFNIDERLIVSENKGIIARFNINDFETDKDCYRLLKIMCCSFEMLEMLDKIHKIENEAFSLKSFDVKRLKQDLEQLIKKATTL